MIWEGKEVLTIGDLSATIEQIVKDGQPKIAQAFLALYRRETEHAEANIGYCCGYMGHDQMVKGLRLFGVEHPIFGDADTADKITNEQAFRLGMELGLKGEETNEGSF